MFRPVLLIPFLLAAPAIAQDAQIPRTDRQFMADVLSLDMGRGPFEESLPRYLDLFRQNDFDGEPGYSLKDREMYVDAWEAKILADRMQDFLKDDLNSDLTVTVEELRVSLTAEAYKRLRIRQRNTTPVPDAVEDYIAEKTAAYLRNYDLNGDDAVSFDEARIKAQEIGRHARDTTVPVPRMAPSLAHDLDGDTVISEAEMIALARQVFDAYDANGDGVIAPKERELAHKLRKTPPAFMRGAGQTAAREVEGPTCPWPRGNEALNYYVVGGYEGAALTNVHFENPNEAVEVVRISVPEEGPDIRIVAAFQTGTILEFDDPGLRVRTVYDTRGPVGVFGAGRSQLIRVDPSCHLEMWKRPTPANPDPTLFYRQVLRRAPAGVVAGYTLGLVDLGTLENEAGRVYPRSVEIDLGGPAAEFWAHVLRFNPGGLVRRNARFVKYGGTVANHPVFPQWAGLAALVEEGALTPLPRSGRLAGVSGTRLSVTIEGKTYRLGGGDDAIHVDGLVYRYEKPGSWVGRAPVSFRIEDTMVFPAGLNGAHAVGFVLPADVPEPIGNPGQSTVSRASGDEVIRE